MLSRKMTDALNEQINAEMWSAYLYLAMSIDAETKGYSGVSNWFYIQWLEELDHAAILQRYLVHMNADVQLLPIAAVPQHWDNINELFTDTLQHEQEVTAMIHSLMRLAIAEQDYATESRLRWFVDEQTEEEASARDILSSLRFTDGNPYGQFAFDQQLAERKYTPCRELT